MISNNFVFKVVSFEVMKWVIWPSLKHSILNFERIHSHALVFGTLDGCWRSLSTKFNHQLNKEFQMKQTSRIRVLSDRIPWALVFIYFCRGLLEYMERRPTCHVYNEIITYRAIFHNLEEYRSHGNEWETGRDRGQAPALARSPIRTRFADYAPPT